MIFAYFNRNYELKEIITENSPRTGSSNVDHIYVYIDFAEEPTVASISLQFLRQGLTTPITPTGTATARIGKELPSDPLRNLSYFSYDHTYEDATGTHVGYLVYDFPIPDALYDGIPSTSTDSFLAQLIATFSIGGTLQALDVLPFTVKYSGIVLDGSINLSQYKYLLTLLSAGVSIKVTNNIASVAESTAWGDIPNGTILFDTADNIFYQKLGDTAPKYQIQANYLQAYNVNSVRGYKGTVTDASSLITNQLILYSDSTDNFVSVKIKQADGTLKGLTVDKAYGDADGLVISETYLPRSGSKPMLGDIEMGSHKIWDLGTPTNNTDATTKLYVDNADTLLQGNITAEKNRAEGVEGGLNTRLGTAEDNITTLQQEVIRIEDSKNIADIVGTKAELLAYDVSKLKVNDIIEVLADESLAEPDKGATSMYRLTSVSPANWSFVGIMHIPAGQLNNTYLRRDGAYPMTNNLNMGGKAITNALDPTNAQDVATKNSSETFTNSKVFRIIDNTDVFDLKIQIVGSDAQLIATKR